MGLFLVSSTLAPEYLLNLLLLQQNVLIKFNLFTPKLSTFSDLELGFSKFLVQIQNYFLAFGRFAPYLERRCVRFATPAVSRVPRTM